MGIGSGLRLFGRNRHYNRGIVHYNRGEYAEAVEAFEQALESIRDPRDPDYRLGAFYGIEARHRLALACLATGDSAAAERHLRCALAARPAYADLHHDLAVALERQGRLEEAWAECERALRANPRYREAQLLVAVCADALGDPLAARRALAEAAAGGWRPPPGVALEPWRGLGEEGRRAILEESRGSGEAERRQEGALERWVQGDREGAIRELSAAVAAEPGWPDLRVRLGTLLAECGRHEEAVREFGRALEIHPGYLEARARRGVSWMARGERLRACEDLARAREAAPDDLLLAFLAATALLLCGHAERAEGLARTVHEEAPEHAATLALLGLVALARGEADEADAFWRASEKAGGPGSEERAWLAAARQGAEPAVRRAHDRLAHALFEGEARVADAAASKLAEHDPAHPLARALRGGLARAATAELYGS